MKKLSHHEVWALIALFVMSFVVIMILANPREIKVTPLNNTYNFEWWNSSVSNINFQNNCSPEFSNDIIMSFINSYNYSEGVLIGVVDLNNKTSFCSCYNTIENDTLYLNCSNVVK